jgi:protocatechuate 3,4-dioxygenase beta subunit
VDLGRTGACRPPTDGGIADGPFYPTIHPADADVDLTWVKGRSARALGQVIEVSGRVFDLHGNPVRTPLWSCGRPMPRGATTIRATSARRRSIRISRLCDAANGCTGRVACRDDQAGGYDSPIGHRTPHIHFDVRGPKSRNIAQLYFPEEAATNAADALYKGLGADAPTSVAVRNAGDPNKYVWDIVMLG